MSRLLADHSRMPARYSYNNTLNSSYLKYAIKAATNSWSSSGCNGCGEHSGTTGEHW